MKMIGPANNKIHIYDDIDHNGKRYLSFSSERWRWDNNVQSRAPNHDYGPSIWETHFRANELGYRNHVYCIALDPITGQKLQTLYFSANTFFEVVQRVQEGTITIVDGHFVANLTGSTHGFWRLADKV